jgi:predicted metal-dependent hydrolase
MSTGLSYILTQSARSHRLTIKVNSQGQIIVTAPRFVPKYKIAEFVESARDWIEKQQSMQERKPSLISATQCLYFGKDYAVKVSTRMDGTVKVGKDVLIVAPLATTHQSAIALLSTWLKARAVEYVTKRVYELSVRMNLPFHGLAFKQQKTRWGSCSSMKNLNFNWKLIHAPKEVIDYVIIHELSHTKEMNHGKRFWDLVSTYDPDHRLHRRWLARYGSTED